ncbi:MAG: acyl-protein synthetase, partial [Gammaproteobacteria bacterium]|nr:acyl-protein synthetase [Gammaproteobacteria bacterium]
GYKGRGRVVAPDALRGLYGKRLGLAPHSCVNEYGMTELLSQRYDGALR